MLTMSDFNLQNKRVLIRSDLNVPMQNGQITSDFRLQAALPTIDLALEQHARVILVSHLGRPASKQSSDERQAFSMRPVADWLQRALGRKVVLIENWEAGIECPQGQLVLLENIRFHAGETANDRQLAKKLAGLCDVFVMDAFGTAHRAHASTCGVIEQAPAACAGPLLSIELAALGRARDRADKPLVAVVGGKKISSKFDVLFGLSDRVDQFVSGGGIANTLLAAAGHEIGQSICEPACIPKAHKLLGLEKFIVPEDVLVARGGEPYDAAVCLAVDELGPQDRIVDIGPKTQALYTEHIQAAGTVIWNGPMGVSEHPLFARGTEAVARAIAAGDAFSIAGGGDTLTVIDKLEIRDGLSLISTGGGAFLEFMEGKPLAAVEALRARAAATPS